MKYKTDLLKGKDGFIMNADIFEEGTKRLPLESLKKMNEGVIAFFRGKEVDLDDYPMEVSGYLCGLLGTMASFAKSLDNGKKGGRPKKETPSKPKEPEYLNDEGKGF